MATQTLPTSPGMWSHGVHSFLEVLRHRLSDRLEHLLAFIFLGHSTMAQLIQAVRSFVETWIECLGDLKHRSNIWEIWIGIAWAPPTPLHTDSHDLRSFANVNLSRLPSVGLACLDN